MILSDPEWQAVFLSLKVSSVAVLFSLPFGIMMAWILARCRFPGKTLLDSVIHLPLVLPPVVVGLSANGYTTGSGSPLPLAGRVRCWLRQSWHFR